jgi:hypothetical protein
MSYLRNHDAQMVMKTESPFSPENLVFRTDTIELEK